MHHASDVKHQSVGVKDNPAFSMAVAVRYWPSACGSALLASNRSVGEWGEMFGDPVVATAILDRLLHHSHIITIRSDS